MLDVEEKQVGLAIGILEDSRRLIAAYKVQRWDVLKWGVTINVALAVAAAATHVIAARWFLFLLSCGVSAGSLWLIWHYNARMTGARNQIVRIVEWFKNKKIDYDSIAGESTTDDYSSGENYDWQELKTFSIVLGISPILVLIPIVLGV